MKTNEQAGYKKLDWDSKFFGYSIAQVTDISLIGAKNPANVGLMQFKVEATNYAHIDQVSALGFSYAEGELQLEKKITPILMGPEIQYRNACIGDLDELIRITRNGFNYSRFRFPWFSTSSASDFYVQWIRNTILESYEDACLIYNVRGQIAGYITLKQTGDSCARIGLLKVDLSAQGKGVGRELIKFASAWCTERSINTIAVATQVSNIRALNLYISTGFRLVNSSLWFYRK